MHDSACLPRCVVGIPTYRRPALLEVLLRGLLPQAVAAGAQIVVADNDCGAEAPAVVRRLDPNGALIHCEPVPERGLSAVRNAIVRTAIARRSDWEWLLMLDDDGQVTPGWLDRMVALGAQHGAHLVGGPVEGVLPETAGRLARNSIFASRRRFPSGPVPSLNTTQNLAISRRTLALLGEPLFRADYGASGGEDYDLFRRVSAAGGTLAWCDEAVVIEPAPADRLTTRALLYRYASTGVYMARIDAGYDGRKAAWRQAVRGLAGAALRTLGASVRIDADGMARGVLATAHQVGRVGGMLGLQTARYAAPPLHAGATPENPSP